MIDWVIAIIAICGALLIGYILIKNGIDNDLPHYHHDDDSHNIYHDEESL